MRTQAGPAAAIADVEARFSGRFGLYAEHLTSGEVIAHHADVVFHSASTIKLAILTALYRRAVAAELSLSDVVTVRPDNRTGGSGVLAALGPDVRLSLHDLAVLMTIVSDNTATNECIDAVGIDYVNAMLDELGIADMRLYRKVRSPVQPPGDVAAPAADEPTGPPRPEADVPFGTATPRSLARLLALLARGEAAPPDACTAVLDILKKQQQNMLLTRYLPGWEEYASADAPIVASKSGRIRGARHDAGIVWHRGVAYVIAIMSDGCADERYHPDNEALVELPKLSLAVYRHFVDGALSGPWVVLDTFLSIYEADQLASLVRSGGFPVLVRPAAGGGLALSGVLPGHEVQVPAALLGEVRSFLETGPSA